MHDALPVSVYTLADEGLNLVVGNTVADREPRNNNIKRAVTCNEGGVLADARHITLAGHYAYITAAAGLVVIDLDDPLHPRHVATVPLNDPRASALQFRYLWVTDADGLKVLDVTRTDEPRLIPEATVPLANAQGLYEIGRAHV